MSLTEMKTFGPYEFLWLALYYLRYIFSFKKKIILVKLRNFVTN